MGIVPRRGVGPGRSGDRFVSGAHQRMGCGCCGIFASCRHAVAHALVFNGHRLCDSELLAIQMRNMEAMRLAQQQMLEGMVRLAETKRMG
jgi:hypothetical protein